LPFGAAQMAIRPSRDWRQIGGYTCVRSTQAYYAS
jgi:hypothetical protein